MQNKFMAAAGLLLLVSFAAQSQPLFEISPHFGYRFGGDLKTDHEQTIGLDAGRAYGLSFDYSTSDNPNIKLEVLWSRQDSGFEVDNLFGKSQVDISVDQFMIGGVLEAPQGNLRPYITGLIGATLFDPKGADPEAYFSLSIGAGVKYFLLPNLALRADLRGYCTIVESDSSFIYYNGITVVHISGSTMWQGEVSAGITLAF